MNKNLGLLVTGLFLILFATIMVKFISVIKSKEYIQLPPIAINPLIPFKEQPEEDKEKEPEVVYVYAVTYTMNGMTVGVQYNRDLAGATTMHQYLKDLNIFTSLFTLSRGTEVTVCYNLETAPELPPKPKVVKFKTFEEAVDFSNRLKELHVKTEIVPLIKQPTDYLRREIPPRPNDNFRNRMYIIRANGINLGYSKQRIAA
ncbi:MAG: hypothetical protein ACW99G_19230 [Candidatus Thorarchaeota archaeon]|jgi:hypothetical protein